jgi:hypothetical protein
MHCVEDRRSYADIMRSRTARLAAAQLALDEPRILNFIELRNLELREAWRRKWRG